MKFSWSLVAAAGLAFNASGAALASTTAPVLAARPSPTGGALPSGETQLASGAVAYRPPSAVSTSLPLIILLHGAGGYPPGFLQSMEPIAKKRGVLLLAPHSLGVTWDLVENMEHGEEPWGGPDARRLDQALSDLFKRSAVDPAHIILLGFSDGATEALSLGLANPKLFTAIVALSPGMYASPRRVDRRQRIFIAHGRSDHVLPFASSNDIADQ